MPDIFLSYARSDQAVADNIASELERLGLSVWWDRQLPSHLDYTAVIEEKLDAAKGVLVLWSQDAIHSEWVRAEANRAREQKKLVQARTMPCRLPLPYDQIHCSDLQGWAPGLDHPSWRSVIASAEALLSDQPMPKRQRHPDKSPDAIRVCVLPFTTREPDQDLAHLGEGLAEDLIVDLSKVKGISVLARNSAVAAASLGLTARQLAEEYGVTHLLSGSVRLALSRVRVSVELVDTAEESMIWGERFDRSQDEIFDLQEVIAGEVISALEFDHAAEPQSSASRQLVDLEALDAYLRGTRPAFDPETLSANVGYLEQAVGIAPDYAEAWGQLAKTRALLRCYAPWSQKPLLVTGVLEAVDQARSLNPDDLGALHARYLLLQPFGQFLDAEKLVGRMRAQKTPSIDSLYYIASHLDSLGRVREAIEVCRLAHDLDPIDANAGNLLGRMLYYGGRAAEARVVLEQTHARWPDANAVAINLLNIGLHTRDWDLVDRIMDPARLERFPLREFHRLAISYVRYFRSDKSEVRDRLLASARRRFDRSRSVDLYQLQLLAQLGFPDEAHDLAEAGEFGPEHFDDRTQGFSAYRPYFLFDYFFSAFRSDRRFVSLCNRLGLVDYWVEHNAWPDCLDEVGAHYDFRAECQRLVNT